MTNLIKSDTDEGRTYTEKSAMFAKVEGASCVLKIKGVYKQSPVYVRDRELYAKGSGGFVKLKATGVTGNPDITLDAIELPFPVELGKLEAISVATGYNALSPPTISAPTEVSAT